MEKPPKYFQALYTKTQVVELHGTLWEVSRIPRGAP